MNTQAQQIKIEANNNSTMFLELADKVRAEFDQDWSAETTYVTFKDGSKASVCGTEIAIAE